MDIKKRTLKPLLLLISVVLSANSFGYERIAEAQDSKNFFKAIDKSVILCNAKLDSLSFGDLKKKR